MHIDQFCVLLIWIYGLNMCLSYMRNLANSVKFLYSVAPASPLSLFLDVTKDYITKSFVETVCATYLCFLQMYALTV